VIAADLDLVTDLLSRGARKDIEDKSGMTALDRAIFRADDSVTAGRIAALLSV
jgi:ankyrin repeat protein